MIEKELALARERIQEKLNQPISEDIEKKAKKFSKQLSKITRECQVETKGKSPDVIRDMMLKLPVDSQKRKCLFRIFMDEYLETAI